jgi:hypothetical protein
MSDEPEPGVLGGLPRTRPHRRSAKRAPIAREDGAPPAETAAERKPAARTTKAKAAAGTKAKPAAGTKAKSAARAKRAPARAPSARSATEPRPQPQTPAPEPASGLRDSTVAIAVQAAAELAEIGLTASARALRGALSRLPRP